MHAFILFGFINMIVNINKYKLKTENKIKVFDLLKYYPYKSLIMLMVFLVLIVYVFSNFMICSSLLQDGPAGILNGTFIQNNHGKIKVITELAYNKLSLIELRGISGHWIIFSLIPVLNYVYKNIMLKIEKIQIV